MRIDRNRLHYYLETFISYEKTLHGTDPRESLKGTLLRIEKEEGYKYLVYNHCKKSLEEGAPYVEKILKMLPGGNLVGYYQKNRIQSLMKTTGYAQLEDGLRCLYEGTDDKRAFEEISSVTGGSFDLLAFLFFLKDRNRYMPVRSRLFDERFHLLGINSGLARHCTWDSYLSFIDLLKDIQIYLSENLNSEITLLDAHSFVWILPDLDFYVNQGNLSMPQKTNKSTIPQLSDKAKEVAEALLQLIANRRRITTYSEVSEMTVSKPDPHTEIPHLLDDINLHCEALKLPHISAMVVGKTTGIPGPGFKKLLVGKFGYDSNLSVQELQEAELERIGKCTEWKRLADSLRLEMPDAQEEHLAEEIIDTTTPVFEGAKKQITVNAYERDRKAVEACKNHYMQKDGRLVCQICGFDFGVVYGIEYANKVHIHHIKPISEIGKEYVVNPVKDLIPVCPNCHLVLHANGGISIKELKKLLGRKNG